MKRAVLIAAILAGAIQGSDSILNDVKTALSAGSFPVAERLERSWLKEHGNSPEAAEGMSWLARVALAEHRNEQAIALAEESAKLAQQRAPGQTLDANPSSAIALGAAIEVQAQAMAAEGRRSEAVALLRREVVANRGTSIVARLNKNLNLLTLEGKLAPPIRFKEWLGPQPVTLLSLRGKPVLLVFWAHWCGDCRGEVPILAQIQKEFRAKGLTLIGPTQRYGYTAESETVSPADELAYIDKIRKTYYADLGNMPVPVDENTFKNYGASTTPTLVLIDRAGIVRMYHPGAIGYAELAAKIRQVT